MTLCVGAEDQGGKVFFECRVLLMEVQVVKLFNFRSRQYAEYCAVSFVNDYLCVVNGVYGKSNGWLWEDVEIGVDGLRIKCGVD